MSATFTSPADVVPLLARGEVAGAGPVDTEVIDAEVIDGEALDVTGAEMVES
jgi:hypothetical protein